MSNNERKVEEKKYKAKVSVLMPICNVEKYLRQCLDSVCRQSLKDIEIICLDDGSKDDSSKIIDEYAAKDDRIVVLHKPNTGYGNTMNEGLKLAKGEYIGIVESDDFIIPTMYEELYDLTEGGKVDLVKGNFWDCYDEENGTLTKVENRERADMPDVEESFVISEHPQLLWGHPSIWTGIYRREFLNEHKICFKEVKGGGWVDNPFFFETLCLAKKIKWTRKPYYCYRKTNSNSSSASYDLRLPFNRMIDNLNAIEKSHHADRETLKFAYARALMYLVGATQEKNYDKDRDMVRPYIQKMLNKMNSDVIYEDFNEWDQNTFLKYRSPINDLIPSGGKVLIYNWVPFDNPNSVGGGVTIYCKNLIQTLIRKRPDITVYFLSSGWAYDISKNETFIRPLNSIFGNRCRCYEVVNSPVPAPIDTLFLNPEIGFENKTLKEVIDRFIEENGEFDAIHFNNLEGLSLDVLDLKKKYVNTKFVFSIHNYVPFCMTGFYFRRDEKCICDEHKDCKKCDSCIDRENFKNVAEEIIARGKYPVPNADMFEEYNWLENLGLSNINEKQSSDKFIEYTTLATNKLNENMDIILAVADRVREIAIKNGIDSSKVVTDYIGTKIADYQLGHANGEVKEFVKVAYLGSDLNYVEKGYPFLLDSLSTLEKDVASKIDLVLTTTTQGMDDVVYEKLKYFHDVNIIHGYKHSDLQWILQGVNLGIIPVLWEDNLPQVAIEMVANGVPVLSSDAGGASELCKSELFKFRSGDKYDFLDKIRYFVDNPESLGEYWNTHNGLTTMQMHFEAISKYYGLKNPKTATLNLEQYNNLLEEHEFLCNHFVLNNSHPEKDAEIERLRQEVEYLRNERERLTQERDEANWHLGETWNSKSYKIGRAVTVIPRTLKAVTKGENA